MGRTIAAAVTAGVVLGGAVAALAASDGSGSARPDGAGDRRPVVTSPTNGAVDALWAAPDGGATGCEQDDPCALGHALATGQEGGTIYLMSGVYPPVSGPPRPDATDWARPLVVTPAPGAADAQLTRLSLKQPNITLRRVHVGPNPAQDADESTPDASLIYQNASATDLRIEDATIEGTGVMIRGDRTTITGTTIDGLRQDGSNGEQVDGVQVGNGVTDISIVGNTIRGARYEDASGYHPDCLHIFDARNVVIRYNHLSDCGNAGLIFSGGRQGLDNVLVEGNYIGGTLEARAAQTQDLVIRRNTVTGSTRLSDPEDELVTVWGERVPARAGLVVDRNVLDYLSYCDVESLTNTIVRSWNLGLCSEPASGLPLAEGDVVPETVPVPSPSDPSWVEVDHEGDAYSRDEAGWDAEGTGRRRESPPPPRWG